MCCGKKRMALRNTSTPEEPNRAPGIPERESKYAQPPISAPFTPALGQPGSSVNLRYTATSPIVVRGRASGREYLFSGAIPVRQVDPRDAEILLGTRLFRRT